MNNSILKEKKIFNAYHSLWMNMLNAQVKASVIAEYQVV